MTFITSCTIYILFQLLVVITCCFTQLCETYPKYLIVPASANITTLMGSSKFRSKGRLPVLSYLHHNKASISRCSQPLSGFSARCLEDEKMLNHVLRTNPNANYMFVVDTRPKVTIIKVQFRFENIYCFVD
jgi:hypothetical protein